MTGCQRWLESPRAGHCKDGAARQGARDACLPRSSFVDRAGRGMVEYRYDLRKPAPVRALTVTYVALAGVVLPDVQLHQLQRW